MVGHPHREVPLREGAHLRRDTAVTDRDLTRLPPMKRIAVDTNVLLLILTLAACGGGGGAPLPEGPTTLAYAVSECQLKGGATSLTRQVLYVRHGDGEPRPVMEFGEVGPEPNVLCYTYFGIRRMGHFSPALWPLQRLGVSRDGSLVVFEVTDDFSLVSQSQVKPGQEGIWVVHADGSGLRRLGPASRSPCITPSLWNAPYFGFSPNGRTVTFADLDSALPQLDAPQVFTLDVGTAEATQLTHLPAATPPTGQLALWKAQFLDAENITFKSYANPPTQNHPNGANPDGVATDFTVKTDGRGLEPVPVLALPGGSIIPDFTITSAEPLAMGVVVPGETPVNGPGSWGDVVREIFTYATNPSQVLQLTNFRRSDTYFPQLTADLQRVVFLASADPLGSNPANHCEVFSIDRLGSDLRQLTNIGEGPPAKCDSSYLDVRVCTSMQLRIDPVTGWVTFYSTCNPLGSNPIGGQIFTMRPDGTGLRQLTAARGMTRDAGTWTVELPGPWAVPTRGL